MMEKLVDTVIATERAPDTIDRAVLATGIFALALALAGTVMLYG